MLNALFFNSACSLCKEGIAISCPQALIKGGVFFSHLSGGGEGVVLLSHKFPFLAKFSADGGNNLFNPRNVVVLGDDEGEDHLLGVLI